MTMPADRIAARIETVIRKGDWKQAQAAIEKQLAKEPEDHWLWARLSGVRYEQRDYQGALGLAEKALALVADCPLALWSKAGALEMLGKTDEAKDLYTRLFRRGLQELNHPDEDANECWEGPDWTAALMADCLFRIAGCLAKAGRRDNAITVYQELLSLPDMGVQGIYSREDVLARLNKLLPSKRARREAAMRRVLERELIPG
jgi:tetratricopeptide (TPR) repeat protein